MEELRIEDISYEGAGVGRIGGKVVFVPKTLPNENVLVGIRDQKSHFCTGKLIKVMEKSPLRVEPVCPYFDFCGGCDFQHCEYETELKIKQKLIKNELKKCGFDEEVDIFPSKKRYFYRNKISFKCENGKLGFYEAKSHNFFEVKKCYLADDKIFDSLEIVRKFLEENNFENLTEVTFKVVDDKLAVVFLFDEKMLQNHEKIKKNAKNLQKLSQFFVFFAYGSVLESNKTKVFSLDNSPSKIQKDFGSFCADVDVSAFEQVNQDVANVLMSEIVSKVDGKKVVNAYSGQGVMTRILAEKADFVWGIELQKSAHESAETLCRGLKNVKCLCGRTEDKLANLVSCENVDVVVLDPPRAGCDKEALSALSNVSKIIYCSCNLATLVRDLKILQSTHKIVSVQAFDMFPCTANLETLVELQRV